VLWREKHFTIQPAELKKDRSAHPIACNWILHCHKNQHILLPM